jgi:penicillin V acylase-like amidase (Ntn superfamily)
MASLRYSLPFTVALVAVATIGFGQVTKFSEKQVAGSGSDLMIVRHIVISGDNKSIGKKLAEIAKTQHHSHLSSGLEARQLKWFESNYPERYDRALGVKAEYGLKRDTNEDYTSLPIDMSLNPACSVVFYPGSSVTNGHAMFSRNYDFPKASYGQLTRRGGDPNARSMTGDPYVIEMHPTKGYASLYTCAYDLLGGAVDGVNSKGVCVALLADDMSRERTRGTAGFGLSEVDLPRFVLDRAASAKEARKLLNNVPYFATFTPCHYIIGDASGDSFIFEVAADGKHYILDGGGKPQIVTNHSIAEYGTKNLPAGNSFDRYRALQKEIEAKGKFSPEEVKTNNFCVAVPTNVRVAATLWHAVYDLKDRSVIISFCLSRADEASERRTPYMAFKLGN